jgi:capsular exopolysaccharide synthesis family protein
LLGCATLPPAAVADGVTPVPVEPGGTRDREALSTALEVLRRRWLLVLGVVLASVAVTVARHETATKSYQATASATFDNSTLTDAALQVTRGSGDPERDAATNVLVASSLEVADRVRKQLNSPATPETLLSAMSIEAAPNANVVNLTASTDNPIFSARLANAFVDQYIAFETQSQIAAIDVAAKQLQAQIAPLPASSAERVTLEQTLQKLNQSRAIASGGVQVISRASPPPAPSGAGLKTTVILGLLIGIALSTALLFLLETLDRRINSIEVLEREYQLPVLTTVPQSAFKRGRAADRSRALEPYRILRSALDFAAVTHRLDTLLVTSAGAGEGKTTVAIDLAHAIALTRRPVVLVELDLRRPTFAQHFALDPRRGITTALTQRATLSDLLLQPLPALPNLSVLPAGALPPNPSELLSSGAIEEILSELSSGDATVVIDAPPLIAVADAQVLLNNPAVHAALLVARLGRITRDQVHRARTILDRHALQPIGLVVTGMRDAGTSGYEAYDDAPTLDEEDAAWQADPREPRRTPY